MKEVMELFIIIIINYYYVVLGSKHRALGLIQALAMSHSPSP
jgi:hypothetical protein